MNNITTIFFDIDNTLLNHSGSEKNALKNIREKYHPAIPYKEFKTIWLNCTKQNWKLYEQKQLTFEQQRSKRIIDVWKAFGKLISNKKAGKIFSEYLMFYEMYWKPFPHVLRTIKKLHGNGLSLGVISNGNKEQQIKKLQRLKIYPYLNKELIIISEEVRYVKPDKEIFLHAQALSKATAKNILFVGDNLIKDIEAGKKMGWNVILFDYFNIYAKQEAIRDFKMILDYG